MDKISIIILRVKTKIFIMIIPNEVVIIRFITLYGIITCSLSTYFLCSRNSSPMGNRNLLSQQTATNTVTLTILYTIKMGAWEHPSMCIEDLNEQCSKKLLNNNNTRAWQLYCKASHYDDHILQIKRVRTQNIRHTWCRWS